MTYFTGWFGHHTKREIRIIVGNLRSVFCRTDLTKLAMIHRTDKLAHGYMPKYQRHFQHIRRKGINLLEIGIGGYKDPWSGGNSLRLWASYFKKARVFGLDIEDKRPHASRRISIFQGDQSDPEMLKKLVDAAGAFDIIIDDGSHNCKDVIASFTELFPHVKDGGIYVIEDTQTSYWEVCGGSMSPTVDFTTMNFFKALADGLNHAEYPLEAYEPSYLDLNVVSIHFYHNMIFVEKGANTLKSNVSLDDRLATLMDA